MCNIKTQYRSQLNGLVVVYGYFRGAWSNITEYFLTHIVISQFLFEEKIAQRKYTTRYQLQHVDNTVMTAFKVTKDFLIVMRTDNRIILISKSLGS